MAVSMKVLLVIAVSFTLCSLAHGDEVKNAPAKKKSKGLKPPKKPLMTVFDQPFRYACGKGQALTGLFSKFSPFHRDRAFLFRCRPVQQLTGTCIWTEYKNSFHQPLTYACPGNNLMTGVMSYHNNFKEDRRWLFRCCSLKCGFEVKCKLSKPINSLRAIINYRTNCEEPMFFQGFLSNYIKKYHDRRWRVRICKVVKS